MNNYLINAGPVVSILDLRSNQKDMNCAFVHAHLYLPADENMHVRIPQGFTKYDKGERKSF